jgi:branched-chain amino acid transport system permease protein
MNMFSVVVRKPFATGLLVLFGILLTTMPFYSPVYTVVLMTRILMYIILAVSWTMFSAPTGKISLATAAFFGVGVYTSAILGFKLPVYAIVLIGGVFSGCVALLVGLLTLRLKGIYFVMFTFGLVEILLHFILWWEVTITGTTGRVVPPVGNKEVFYVLLIIFMTLVVIANLLRRSRYGLALQSIGDYEEAAAHTGVNVTELKISAFALSAFFMGAAGAIMATRWTYIDPKIAFNPNLSFLPVLMAIFGGMSALYGPIIGAAIFTYLEEFLITKFPYHYMLIFGIIMVMSILYMPDGVVGLFKKMWDHFRGETHADT